MRKRKLVSVLLVFFAIFLNKYSYARQVDKNEVERVAASFLNWQSKTTINQFPKQITRRIISIEGLQDQENPQVLAHIVYIQPEGFLIVSTDTNIEPIIAYSFRHHWCTDTSSENILQRMIIRDLKLRKQYLDAHNVGGVEKINIKWEKGFQSQTFQQWPERGTTGTGGWLETTWHQ
ncbi:MAG: Spi family protease inhibitor, partial [bacterium]